LYPNAKPNNGQRLKHSVRPLSMLKEHIEILQKQMLLRLAEIRAAYRHSGNKGANAEQVLRDFLRQFLPPYNRVGHGEVIDQSGASSRQLDAIITNEYHPFLNDLSAPSVFIIEGVSCVAEVKSVLTSDELIRTLENSLSFKRLSVTLQKGATVFGNREDISRFVEKRPSFLFAFESQLSVGTIKERIEAWNKDHQLPIPQQMDAVFVLTGGSIINFGTGAGSLQFITPDGQSLSGYVFTDPSEDRPLISLLSWISASLPHFSLPSPPILNYFVKDAASLKKESTSNEA